jgi:hypothetical protein
LLKNFTLRVQLSHLALEARYLELLRPYLAVVRKIVCGFSGSSLTSSRNFDLNVLILRRLRSSLNSHTALSSNSRVNLRVLKYQTCGRSALGISD